MKIDRRVLKARAREAMGQTQPRFWAVALVYILLTTGVQIAQKRPCRAEPAESFSTSCSSCTPR